MRADAANSDAAESQMRNVLCNGFLLRKTPRVSWPEGAAGIFKAAQAKPTWNVEDVVAKIPGGPPEVGSESPVPFFHMLERLKTTKREGWRRFGIQKYAPPLAPLLQSRPSF